MIKAIYYNCCLPLSDSIKDTTTKAIDALHHAIKSIREYNLGLIAIALGCACYHDHHLVLIYGIVGGIFYQQVSEINKSVNAVFKAVFQVILGPSMNLFSYSPMNWPAKSIVYGSAIFMFLLLKPTPLLLTEALLIANCGANIVSVSRRLVEEQERDSINKAEGERH